MGIPAYWTRIAGTVAALATVSAVLTGCGQQSGATPAPSNGAALGGFPRTVPHAMGTARIERPPRRVLAMDQAFVDAAVALETPIVGYTTFTAKDPGLLPYLGAAGKTYGKGAVSVGLLTDPKAEKIAQVRPDLILSSKVRHEAGYRQLAKLGVPVVFSANVGVTWKQDLRLTARALGKERLAEQRIKAYEQRAKKIGDAVRLKSGKNPTVSVVRFAGEPTTRLYTQNSFIGGILFGDIGLARPKGQPTSKDIAVDVSQERIGDFDADHIFIAAYDDGTGGTATIQRKFQQNPLWSTLRGQQHNVADNAWLTSVGIVGANVVLDDVARTFGVDPARS